MTWKELRCSTRSGSNPNPAIRTDDLRGAPVFNQEWK
jgi:hypothetical protein